MNKCRSTNKYFPPIKTPVQQPPDDKRQHHDRQRRCHTLGEKRDRTDVLDLARIAMQMLVGRRAGPEYRKCQYHPHGKPRGHPPKRYEEAEHSGVVGLHGG